jgi:hypothetical protein
MLNKEEKDLLQYLKKVSEIFNEKIETSEGVEKDIYERLNESINFIVKNYQSFKDGSYDNGKYAESDEFDASPDVLTFIKTTIAKEDRYKDLGIITASISFLSSINLIGTLPDFFAKILREEFLRWECGMLSSLRNGGFEWKESFKRALEFKPLGIGYMTDQLWDMLKHRYDTGLAFKNGVGENIGDSTTEYWTNFFDSQKSHNAALTSCKQIEIALEYAYDEKVRDFIEKEINGRKEVGVSGINGSISECRETLEDQRISQELRTHLEYTEKRCNEVIEKTRDYQKIAISEISSLFQGNNISKDDAGAIAFLAFKKLKKDGKLNGIENMDITKIEEAFAEENIDKTFIKDIFSKVKARASGEKTDSTVEKVILTIEEFLLTLWYAVKLYLFRDKEERQDINKTSDWASFLAESRSSDVAVVNRDL